MTLDELCAKVPEEWQPVVRKYAPALLAMSADEVWNWIQLLADGKDLEAYRVLLAGLDNPELLDEWTALAIGWSKANRANADRLALQRKAVAAILQVLLGVALALVGL